MPEISGGALIAAIQAIDDKIIALKTQVDQTDSPEKGLVAMEDELLMLSKTAYELRDSYCAAKKTIGNLPPYEALVR